MNARHCLPTVLIVVQLQYLQELFTDTIHFRHNRTTSQTDRNPCWHNNKAVNHLALGVTGDEGDSLINNNHTHTSVCPAPPLSSICKRERERENNICKVITGCCKGGLGEGELAPKQPTPHTHTYTLRSMVLLFCSCCVDSVTVSLTEWHNQLALRE